MHDHATHEKQRLELAVVGTATIIAAEDALLIERGRAARLAKGTYGGQIRAVTRMLEDRGSDEHLGPAHMSLEIVGR